MSAMLRPDDRAKLIKVLALLSSDRAGEIAAAGKAALRIIHGAGTSWDEIIILSGQAMPQPVSSRDYCATAAGGFRETLAWLDRRSAFLSEWETQFVGSIRTRRALTSRQTDKLAQIVADVTVREARP